MKPREFLYRIARLSVPVLAFCMAFSLLGIIVPVKVAKAGGEPAFSPPTVRGFNSGAYGQLERAKQVFGANALRLMVSPRVEASRSHISVAAALEVQLTKLESALQEAARQGMYVIIDMHDAPIDNVSLKANTAEFWNDTGNLNALIDAWKLIVQRVQPYKDYIWGYDLFNEPYSAPELPIGNVKWPIWAQAITDSIRQLDKETPVIYEVSPGALPRAFIENEWIDAGPGYPVLYQGELPLLKDDKVIYSVHMYDPSDYTHQGLSVYNGSPLTANWSGKWTYPGLIGDTYWDKDRLRAQLQPVIDIQKKYNVPIYVGEFSAIRWAPGAAQYIRDCIELFEELGWSWTYHAFMEWQGWNAELNEAMTSDANVGAAKPAEPTDRELILKAYFNKNTFAPPTNYAKVPINLIANGGFERDSNQDGLADSWIKGSAATATIVQGVSGSAQRVTTTTNGQGIDQEWINVSDRNTYRVKADIRVDKGTVRFWLYDITNAYTLTGSTVVGNYGNTNGQFVTRELEFILPPNTGKVSVRFWANDASDFTVDNVELIDLGENVTEHPPLTKAAITQPGHVDFTAAAYDGAQIVGTQYRIVGQNDGWQPVPSGGVTLTSGNTIVGYRSSDTSGHIEWGKALLVGVSPGKPVLSDDNGYDNGIADGSYNVRTNLWWGVGGDIYRLYENGKLIDIQNLSVHTPEAQSVVTPITGRSNGVYSYYAELANVYGATRSEVWTVEVTQATPGKPVLSHDNWDGDGSFHITMNLWWGTNGSVYSLYENGVLIDTQTLTEQTSQSAVTAIQSRTAGSYTYVAELANAAGATSSDPLVVQVIAGP